VYSIKVLQNIEMEEGNIYVYKHDKLIVCIDINIFI